MNHSSTADAQSSGSRFEPQGARARPRWRGLEIAAVVLGFVLYWPIGMALLFWKLWRNKNGQSEDFVTAARGAWQENVMGRWPEAFRGWGCGAARRDAPAAGWGFGGPRPTGNSAFDDWRSGELARLEEERRKLEAAEREFADYIESLRRAKDREEFERFMRDRNSGSGAQQ
ncbi:MAG: hypothetical protein JWN93_1257 [Hyphomicrobiales bacterium]|nr:hypothetical protein [Hyphomicrobiales bacterium]